MGFPCDICGNHAQRMNYRRRRGDVLCKTCLEQWDCYYGHMVGDGGHAVENPDGFMHPSENPEFDGGENGGE